MKKPWHVIYGSGLKIGAGQRLMSGQKSDLSGQSRMSSVNLSGQNLSSFLVFLATLLINIFVYSNQQNSQSRNSLLLTYQFPLLFMQYKCNQRQNCILFFYYLSVLPRHAHGLVLKLAMFMKYSFSVS